MPKLVLDFKLLLLDFDLHHFVIGVVKSLRNDWRQRSDDLTIVLLDDLSLDVARSGENYETLILQIIADLIFRFTLELISRSSFGFENVTNLWTGNSIVLKSPLLPAAQISVL